MEKWFKHSYFAKFYHGRRQFQRTPLLDVDRGSAGAQCLYLLQTLSRNQWFHLFFGPSVIHFAESEIHCTFDTGAGNARYLGHALWCSQAPIYFLSIWVQPSLQQDFQWRRGFCSPCEVRKRFSGSPSKPQDTIWPVARPKPIHQDNAFTLFFESDLQLGCWITGPSPSPVHQAASPHCPKTQNSSFRRCRCMWTSFKNR